MDERQELIALRRLAELEAKAASSQKHEQSVIDAPNAVATGYSRGLVRLAGLPVDTVANVIDLGKAAIGVPYSAATGKAPPDWLVPEDRANVVGSSEYLLNKVRSNKLGRVIVDPQNPAYEGGYLQAAGGGLSAVMAPNSAAQAVNQGALGVTSALSGKAVGDVTGSEALAITAGMVPLAVQRGTTELTKRAVRGDEAGRRAMEQRIQDLKSAGIENPTLGLASGNAIVGGAENLLQNAPGAVGRMRDARQGAVNALEVRAADAAQAASHDRGAYAAGAAIQAGLKDTFKGAFKAKQNALYNALESRIGSQTPTNVDSTRSTLAALNEDIPSMPELSKQFKNARIQAIEAALKSDMAGNATGSPVALSSIVDSAGKPIVLAPQGAPTPARTEIPFDAVKQTRTLVGNELADHSLMSNVPRSKWNPLYGALTGDMKAAAVQAGPAAESAFNRANDHTRAGIARMERVAPFADRPAPEQSYRALANTLGENVSSFQAVKKSLPEGVRGQVAGTVIERLGRANNGVQNDAGTVWSPETFLTNWNKMTPKARNELLSGFENAPQVKADIEAVAKATSLMRENSKIWANPSGTAANAAARTTLGAVGVGGLGAMVGLVNPLIPIGAGATMIGSNLLARGVTNKGVVDSFARPTNVNPELTQAQINALIGSGLLEESKKH